jgi:hypothetical protein
MPIIDEGAEAFCTDCRKQKMIYYSGSLFGGSNLCYGCFKARKKSLTMLGIR